MLCFINNVVTEKGWFFGIPKIVDIFSNDITTFLRLAFLLFILNNLLFGDTSLFDEKTKKDGIITSSLYVNTLNIDTHFIISLINSCDKYEELIKRNEIYQDVYYSQNKITKGGNSND